MTLRNVHKWLAAIVGLQFFIWIGTGIVISYLDPETTSGSVTRAPPVPAVPLAQQLAAPLPLPALSLDASRLVEVSLTNLAGTPVYRVKEEEGVRLLDALSGEPLAVDALLAAELAANSYRGQGKVAGVSRLAASVHELAGFEDDIWQVEFDDDLETRVLLAADDGRLLAHRNAGSELLEFLLMLHFMDYSGGHDFNNPLIILMGLLTLTLVCSGGCLLWRRFA